jgi:hypothetical protein
VLNCTRICPVLVYNFCTNNKYESMHVTVAVAVTVRDIRLRDARLFESCLIPLLIPATTMALAQHLQGKCTIDLSDLVSHLLLSQYASGTPSTGPLSIFLLVLQINSQCIHLVPPRLIPLHSPQHLLNYACTLYADRGRSSSLHNYLAFADFAKQSRTNALRSTRLFDLRSRSIGIRGSSKYSSHGVGIQLIPISPFSTAAASRCRCWHGAHVLGARCR